MKAEIITIGTELLLGNITNFNSKFLSIEFAKLGIDIYYHTSVGDNFKRIIEVIKIAVPRSELLIFTGGLGPTIDDITKETVCNFFNKKLTMNNNLLNNIKTYFQSKNVLMTKSDFKTAFQPSNSTIFNNKIGTAPGFIFYDEKSNTHVLLLPGPTNELKYIFKYECINYLKLLSNFFIYSKYIKFINISESLIEEKIKHIINSIKNSNITLALYAKKYNKCWLRISIKVEKDTNVNKLIKPIINEIKKLLGEFIYYIGKYN